MDTKNRNTQDMDKADAITIARQYARSVREKYSNARVFLFGSFAKGNFNADSDIDVAVVLKDYDRKSEILLDLMRLRRKIDSRIEPHPFRENDFNLMNPIAGEILRYGNEIKADAA
jgi:uncharacterized protein